MRRGGLEGAGKGEREPDKVMRRFWGAAGAGQGGGAASDSREAKETW
jgi:hypothetical protein